MMITFIWSEKVFSFSSSSTVEKMMITISWLQFLRCYEIIVMIEAWILYKYDEIWNWKWWWWWWWIPELKANLRAILKINRLPWTYKPILELIDLKKLIVNDNYHVNTLKSWEKSFQLIYSVNFLLPPKS